MKVTKIVVSPLDPYMSLISVETDEGITGWGSCFMAPSLAEACVDLFSEMIVGKDPVQNEKIIEDIHESSMWIGRGGVVTIFISAIDIALWDIRGKKFDTSVSRLLGARYRESIKPYASMLFGPVDDLEKRLTDAYEAGYRAFKLGWQPFGRIDAASDESLIRRARKTIGDGCDLMVDAGGSEAYWHNDLKWAVRTSRMLEQYNVLWFEEALSDQNMIGHAALRAASPIWIASGETFRKRQAFQSWIETGALDVVQPDLSAVGGISEGRRIAWSAQDHGMLTVFHGWNTAVGLSADLQLNASLPHGRFVEFKTPSPYIEELLVAPFKIDGDGLLPIPDGPGLGIEIDKDRLEYFVREFEGG